MLRDLLLAFMMFSMVMVLVVSWKWFGSFRKAFLVMLLVGKIWAGILWAYGIDKPLFNIIIYNKVKETSTTITITADQFIFLSFLGTFMVTVFYPYIEPYIPSKIRAPEVIE